MRKERNSKILSEQLFDVIEQVLNGSIDPNVADVAFNGAGKWIALQKVRLEYRTVRNSIEKIGELEDGLPASKSKTLQP